MLAWFFWQPDWRRARSKKELSPLLPFLFSFLSFFFSFSLSFLSSSFVFFLFLFCLCPQHFTQVIEEMHTEAGETSKQLSEAREEIRELKEDLRTHSFDLAAGKVKKSVSFSFFFYLSLLSGLLIPLHRHRRLFLVSLLRSVSRQQKENQEERERDVYWELYVSPYSLRYIVFSLRLQSLMCSQVSTWRVGVRLLYRFESGRCRREMTEMKEEGEWLRRRENPSE